MVDLTADYDAGIRYRDKILLLQKLASLEPGTKVVLIDISTLEERSFIMGEPPFAVEDSHPKQVGAVMPRGTGASFFTRDTPKQGVKQTW